ncbi:hypothetical protein P3X46_026906 [Hevea brasiliensis]|uniref:Uncharacterized protein n=1 Tax=Hevea brasiliensis TaxID=3981 RepID=A0ABQ9L133_HEVBR|nr:hypothetical protein P3X46_026906 [Hevea brasiliensis]
MALVGSFMPNKVLLPMPNSRLSFYQRKTMFICGARTRGKPSDGKPPQINTGRKAKAMDPSQREENVTLSSFNNSEKESKKSKGKVDDGMETDEASK